MLTRTTLPYEGGPRGARWWPGCRRGRTGIELSFVGDDIWLGMLPGSRKAPDARRPGRRVTRTRR